jgi:hypothetical protein
MQTKKVKGKKPVLEDLSDDKDMSMSDGKSGLWAVKAAEKNKRIHGTRGPKSDLLNHWKGPKSAMDSKKPVWEFTCIHCKGTM